MNKRIKELAEQSYKEVIETNDYNGSAYTVREFDQEKFAVLIIEECLRMCDCADVSLLEHSYPREADGAASVKIFIKEHFGVEE